MGNTLTPHNSAKRGEIAKTVLMPGDPLRAEYIAKTYFENPICFNQVRNMLGYTGTYNGKEISVMGSGMGMPSIGIYSYELYHFYGVDNIIRIGTAGAIQDDINLKDIVVGMGACTDSNYASHYKLPGTFAPIADYDLVEKAVEVARRMGKAIKVGNVVSGDMFYEEDDSIMDAWKKMGVLAGEMETAALYMNAARAHKNALGLFTVSDHLYRKERLNPEERQKGLNDMIEIALQIATEI